MKVMRAAVASLLLLGSTLAFADGKYFGDSLSVTQPEMPRQRALITYRDGVETLMVESVVSGARGELAWILPVPSKPIEIGFATEGTVATLPTVLEPEIVVADKLLTMGLVLLACLTVLFGFSRIGAKGMTASRFAVEFVVVLLLWFFVGGFFFPVFSKAGGSRAAGSQWVESQGMEATVVDTGGTLDVLKWLAANKFKYGVKEAAMIDTLVREGWSFVVCRAKSDGGASSPKPLRVSFKTDAPVYPMRLTGVGATELLVDVCIAADSPMVASGLVGYETAIWNKSEPITRHPRIGDALWEGAHVTRLVGSLKGSALTEDVVFRKGGSVGKRKVSEVGTIGAYVLDWLAGGLIVSTLVAGFIGIKRGWTRELTLKCAFFPPVLIAGISAVWCLLTMPPVGTERGRRMNDRFDSKIAESVAAQWAEDIELEDVYRKELEKNTRGVASRWGKDVPGGVLRESDFVVSFDSKGNPKYHKIREGTVADP
jgi:hypothetical protein